MESKTTGKSKKIIAHYHERPPCGGLSQRKEREPAERRRGHFI